MEFVPEHGPESAPEPTRERRDRALCRNALLLARSLRELERMPPVYEEEAAALYLDHPNGIVLAEVDGRLVLEDQGDTGLSGYGPGSLACELLTGSDFPSLSVGLHTDRRTLPAVREHAKHRDPRLEPYYTLYTFRSQHEIYKMSVLPADVPVGDRPVAIHRGSAQQVIPSEVTAGEHRLIGFCLNRLARKTSEAVSTRYGRNNFTVTELWRRMWADAER